MINICMVLGKFVLRSPEPPIPGCVVIVASAGDTAVVRDWFIRLYSEGTFSPSLVSLDLVQRTGSLEFSAARDLFALAGPASSPEWFDSGRVLILSAEEVDLPYYEKLLQDRQFPETLPARRLE